MIPSKLVQALAHRFDTPVRKPVFVWGPPGGGKSDVIKQFAAGRKIGLRDVRLSQFDPTDLKGFPVADLKKQLMSWLPGDFLPREGKGVLFLDELNHAIPAVQSAAYQLVLDGKLGDYVLPPGWRVIAAGNREGDRSGVQRMPSALSNRFTHLDFEVSLPDFAAWAVVNGIDDGLLAFLRFKSALLHSFDPSKNERSYPTPRSWMMVNEDINAPIPMDIRYDLIKGSVGEGAATELIGFLRMRDDLPDVDAILMNPDSAPVPTMPSALFAVATTLGMRSDQGNFDRMMQYVTRMPIEYQVVMNRDASTIDLSRAPRDSITKTKAYTKWAIANSDVMS